MNAGNLQNLITVRTLASQSLDIYGEPVKTYATQSTWAKVKSLNGGESAQNNVFIGSAAYEFTIRSGSADVQQSSEVLFNGNAFNVRYVDQPFGRNQWLIIRADRQMPNE